MSRDLKSVEFVIRIDEFLDKTVRDQSGKDRYESVKKKECTMLTLRQRWAVAAIAVELFLDLAAFAVAVMPLTEEQKTWGLVIALVLTALWNVVLFIWFMRITPGSPAVPATATTPAVPAVIGPSVATIKAGLFTVVIETLLDAIALSLLLIPMGLVASTILGWVIFIVIVTTLWDGVVAYYILR